MRVKKIWPRGCREEVLMIKEEVESVEGFWRISTGPRLGVWY